MWYHLGIVSVLVSLMIDTCCCYFLELVNHWAVLWAVFFIIRCFCILALEWLVGCFFVTWFSFNTAVHRASKVSLIETSELCLSLGNIFPPRSSSVKSGKSSKQGLLDWMVLPFGHPTWMGGAIFYGICEASGLLGTPVTFLLYGVLLMILLA